MAWTASFQISRHFPIPFGMYLLAPHGQPQSIIHAPCRLMAIREIPYWMLISGHVARDVSLVQPTSHGRGTLVYMDGPNSTTLAFSLTVGMYAIKIA